MATSTTKCIIVAILSMATISPQILINGQDQQVPCFFAFGDSLSDNGNNNNFISVANTNYLPYGIDFFDETGSFTNGLNIPDLIAQRLGFSSRIPPFATAGGSNAILRGVNYASGAGGILEETAVQQGQRISMNEQLKNHEETVNRIAILVGNETAAGNLLRQCLYSISMSNEDYVNNYYFLPITVTRTLYTPEMFAERLIQQYSLQLRIWPVRPEKTLYSLGARKVAVFGSGPIGCIPRMLFLYPINIGSSSCVEFINDAVQLFNNKLISLIKDLNNNLSGAHFTYINLYSFLVGDLSTIGIRVPNAPCCQVNIVTGLCVRNGGVCSNRNEYTYFDEYHPTQFAYNYSVSRAYVAQSPSDAVPVDIRTLVQQ